MRDRIGEKLWIRLHPDAPWLTPAAVPALQRLLRSDDRVFEWGAGRSTVWFARRTAAVTSIESDPAWHAKVERDLQGHRHARCVLIECDRDADAAAVARYCDALGDIEAGPVDVVLVDGLFRGRCALAAVDHLAPGGMLIVDDVHRYLPSSSRAPGATRRYSSPAWESFAARVADWPVHWFGSGVTDTALWIRPGGAPRG